MKDVRMGFVFLAVAFATCGAWGFDKLPAKDAFHLYLLVGQDNMAGRGKLAAGNRVDAARVLKFTKNRDWAFATEPIHFDKPSAAAGPGASFGRALADADASVTVGLVPCAVGGTPISRWKPGSPIYRSTVDRCRAAMKFGTLKGILWHQGENDAASEYAARKYPENLQAFAEALRKDLGAGDVPFVVGEVGHFLDSAEYPQAEALNERIRAVAKKIPNCLCVSAEGLDQEGSSPHFSAEAVRTLGRRYATAVQQLERKILSERK